MRIPKLLAVIFTTAFISNHLLAQQTHPPGNLLHVHRQNAPTNPLDSILGTAQTTKRRDLPLTAAMAEHHLQTMREHLQTVESVTTALGNKDYETALKSAKSLASSSDTTSQCDAMGAAAPGFSALGQTLHKKADSLAQRISERDLTQSLKALGDTLKTCTSCHSTYQHRIVSDEEFRKLTKPK